MKTELEAFDGLDNRKEIMILLQRLGTNERRAQFIMSVIPDKFKKDPRFPSKVTGPCDPVSAYFMLISVCNELGASINVVAKRLEEEVKKL